MYKYVHNIYINNNALNSKIQKHYVLYANSIYFIKMILHNIFYMAYRSIYIRKIMIDALIKLYLLYITYLKEKDNIQLA